MFDLPLGQEPRQPQADFLPHYPPRSGLWGKKKNHNSFAVIDSKMAATCPKQPLATLLNSHALDISDIILIPVFCVSQIARNTY